MDLELYVEDESIDSPFLQKAFIEEIFSPISYLILEEFLTKEEVEILTPNPYGEIILGKKAGHTVKDRARTYQLLYQSMQPRKVSIDTINNFRDKFVHRSEALVDRERDPILFKKALSKIEHYMQTNSNHLPLVHTLYDSKEEAYFIKVNGVSCVVEGNLWLEKEYSKKREYIRIKSYNEDYGKVDWLLSIAEEMSIGGVVYTSKSITKAQQFEEDFKKCYDFLDRAIEANKGILWEY